MTESSGMTELELDDTTAPQPVLAVVGRKQLQKVEGMPRTTDTAKRVPDALKGNEDPR